MAERERVKVVVYHGGYGCDTGCCGHWVSIGDDDGSFAFDHPYREDPRAFAERLITKELGAEHVADLDWENSLVLDD